MADPESIPVERARVRTRAEGHECCCRGRSMSSMFSRTGAALGAVGAALLASCSNARDELTGAAYDGALESVAHTDRCDAPPDISASVQLARDVPYTQPGGQTLRMDVAWSTGGGPAPLILLLH